METLLLGENQADIEKAAAILRAGGIVAFPTETVYGLGADALNPQAVGDVYAAKGRPSDNPMIVHIADLAGLYRLMKQKPDAGAAMPARAAFEFLPEPVRLCARSIGDTRIMLLSASSGGGTRSQSRMPARLPSAAYCRESTPLASQKRRERRTSFSV